MYKKSKNNRSGEGLPSGASKVMLLSASAITEVSLYMLAIKTESVFLYVFLYILCALLFVSAFVLSGAGMKKIPAKSELRDSFSDKTKDRIIAFLTVGKRINKIIIPILLPLVFILGFDIIKAVFFE